MQEVRGLRFTEPVSVEAASHAELVDGLERSFDSTYPAELYQRRTSAWQTIGVIPPTTGVREALEAQRQGSGRDALALHQAERWRDELIGDDQGV